MADESSEGQRQLDTRALEMAVEAKTMATMAVDGQAHIHASLQELRRENTEQHTEGRRNQQASEDRLMSHLKAQDVARDEGQRRLHGRLNHLVWWLLGIAVTIIGALFGVVHELVGKVLVP